MQEVLEQFKKHIGCYYTMNFNFKNKDYLVYSTSVEKMREYVLTTVNAGPIQRKRISKTILHPKESKISKKKLIMGKIEHPCVEAYFFILFHETL